MKKHYLTALLGLLTVSFSEASAQIIFARPGSRAGFIAPIGGGGGPLGGPFSSPFGGGFFGGGTYSPPVTPAPNVPGYSPGITGRTTQGAYEGQREGESITGHPTRFMSYSHYFMNQGGGGGMNVAGQQPQPLNQRPQLGVMVGGDYSRAPGGAAPPRPPRAPSGGGGRR